jgi:hypothetical protein
MWLARFDAEGDGGPEDRSCRPHRLRRRKRAAWEIAAETGVPTSTVSRHLQAEGLGRLWRIDEAEHPPQRYEHAYAGSLFHVDAKRLGRIAGIGHAIHGDRRRRGRGAGWEVVCIDDYSRLAYAEV